MNIKYIILSLLFVTSVMAAGMTSEAMAQMLIAAKDDALEEIFTKFEKEQDGDELCDALTEMAMKEEHMPKAVRCLEMAKDPYPEEASRVSWLVHNTVVSISTATIYNTKAFANVVASFKPNAVKPLASIRYDIIWRKDARAVLEQVMKKSPELITSSLPRWLVSHGFDQNSRFYKKHESPRKRAFEYLASYATESVLSEALIIAKKNEHYKKDSRVWCCSTEASYPSDLINKLEALLKLVQGRKKRLEDILALLPAALIDLVNDYLTVGDSLLITPSILESIAKSCLVM